MSTVEFPSWNPAKVESLNAFAYWNLVLGVILLPVSIIFLMRNKVNNKHVTWLKFTPVATALLFLMMFATSEVFNSKGYLQAVSYYTFEHEVRKTVTGDEFYIAIMNCNWGWWFGIQIVYNLLYMVPLIVSYLVLLGCWDKNTDESPCIDCSYVCLRVICVLFTATTLAINFDIMFRFWLLADPADATEVTDIYMYYKKVVVLQNWINFIMLCAAGSYSSWAAYEQWNVVKTATDKDVY